jgi:bacteriocin biosynthesis cyclodehydratase domain-containing protein
MKSVWVYAPEQYTGRWFDALAPSLAEGGIEHRALPPEAWQGGDQGVGRTLSEAAGRADCLLCVTPATDPLLSDINRACRAVSLPLLLVSPSDATLQVGPGVVFGTSPCLACFENHCKFLPLDDTGRALTAETHAGTPMLDSPLLKELTDFVAASPASTLRRGYVIRADSAVGTLRRFRVLKNPTCMVCSVFAEHPTESLRIDN